AQAFIFSYISFSFRNLLHFFGQEICAPGFLAEFTFVGVSRPIEKDKVGCSQITFIPHLGVSHCLLRLSICCKSRGR
ncbi:MAG: hypothetical protein ACKO13_07355, partial [Cytophagales bacterium]